ncbi:4-hydroxy-tetrahydrodipicolinate reductase [bacterium]|nr:4-hydroxy-tetrahydrodipicolinate reductase [bacterium]
MIKVLVCGAAGRMGREVIKAISQEEDMSLVSAVDVREIGKDAGELAGIGKTGILIEEDLLSAIKNTSPDVMVDFTQPSVVKGNMKIAMENGVVPVVGTTGLKYEDIEEIKDLAKKTGVGAFIAPNFSLGANLMMHIAKQVARFLQAVEIIELHHEKKLDAPSGTAIRTAQLLSEVIGDSQTPDSQPSRGDTRWGIRIHSVRLPGLVAHQEIIFGGQGETLTIRHDAPSRECYMPGVKTAIRKAVGLKEVIVGLDKILGL